MVPLPENGSRTVSPGLLPASMQILASSSGDVERWAPCGDRPDVPAVSFAGFISLEPVAASIHLGAVGFGLIVSVGSAAAEGFCVAALPAGLFRIVPDGQLLDGLGVVVIGGRFTE